MSNGHDIPGLEKKIKRLRTDWRKLASKADSNEELIRIIRQKGWTTPAEFRLVLGQVEALSQQIQVVLRLQDSLMEGSRLVEEIEQRR
jgi:hypothetical protein